MKCRKVVKNGDHYDIVWFGRYGKNEEDVWNDGSTSYAENQEGLASSLIQRLNVLKGELWYKVNYGLPLFEKIKDKDVMDSVIINIILTHPDVASIKTLQSSIENNAYVIKNLEIISIFNEEILLY